MKPKKAKPNQTAPNDVVSGPILTVPETAGFLRISESLLWKMIRQDEIKPLRLGDRVLFSRAYLEKFCGIDCEVAQ
jgi:excisionase family DNA binding protein